MGPLSAGAGCTGRAAAAGVHGAGRADAPDADAVPELLPAVRAEPAGAAPHARPGAAAAAAHAAAPAVSCTPHSICLGPSAAAAMSAGQPRPNRALEIQGHAIGTAAAAVDAAIPCNTYSICLRPSAAAARAIGPASTQKGILMKGCDIGVVQQL